MSTLTLALKIDAALGNSFNAVFTRTEKTIKSLDIATSSLTARQQRLGSIMSQALAKPNRALGEMQRHYQEITRAIDQTIRAQDRLTRSAAANDRINRNLSQARSNLGSTTLATTMMAAPAVYAAKSFMDQDAAAANLKITMLDASGKVGSAFDALSKEAIKLGNQLPGTTTDFYNLVTALKGQGISDNKLVGGGFRTSAYLNVLLDMDQVRGGEFFAKMLEAHGLNEKDFNKGADLVQRARFGFGLKPEDMLDAMKYYSPVTNTLGIKGTDNMEKLFALQGMGAQVGLEGASFGTNFSMMLAQMAEGPEKLKNATRGMKAEAADMVKGAGVSFDFFKKDGQFAGIDNMVKQIEKLNNIEKKYGVEGSLIVAKELFGTEAGRPAQIIAQKGWAGYQANIELMRKQADITQRIAVKTSTLKNAWESATGTLTNFAATLGGHFAPELQNIFIKVNDWIAGPMTAFVIKHKEGIKLTVKFAAGLMGLKLGFWAVKTGVLLLLSPLFKAVELFSLLNARFALFRALQVAGGGSRVANGLQAIGLSGGMSSRIASGASSIGRALLSVGRIALWAGRLLMFTPWGLAITAGAILIHKYWKPIKGFFTGFWHGLSGVAGPALKKMWHGIVNVGKSLWGWLKKIPIIGSLFAKVGNIASFAWDCIVVGAKTVWTWIKNLFKPVEDTGKKAERMGEKFGKAFGSIIVWITNLPAKFYKMGGDVVNGLVNGIKAKYDWAKKAIYGLGDAISSAFSSKLEIHSPSRVFVGFGKNIAHGAAIGITTNRKSAIDAVAKMASHMTNAASGQISGSNSKTGHITFSPQITIQGNANQADVQAALRVSQREFEAMYRKMQANNSRIGYA